jgi:hypothetical protein
MTTDLDCYDGLAKLRRMHEPCDYAAVHVARWRRLIADADLFCSKGKATPTR